MHASSRRDSAGPGPSLPYRDDAHLVFYWCSLDSNEACIVARYNQPSITSDFLVKEVDVILRNRSRARARDYESTIAARGRRDVASLVEATFATSANFSCELHADDDHDGMTAMVHDADDDVVGCELVFPTLKAAVLLRPGDLVIYHDGLRSGWTSSRENSKRRTTT